MNQVPPNMLAMALKMKKLGQMTHHPFHLTGAGHGIDSKGQLGQPRPCCMPLSQQGEKGSWQTEKRQSLKHW